MNLDSLKPRKFLSLGRYNLPHVGDLTQPYFVAIGCSLTSGHFLDYKDTWSYCLSKKTNLEHINLAMSGSSLDYQYDKLVMSEKILNDAKFVVWMHTYPTRWHLTLLSHVIGDKMARQGRGGNLQYHNKHMEKIKNFVSLTKTKKVLHTNTWGYDKKTILAIGKLISRNNKKYFLNKNEWLDRASDGLHAGPKSHEIISQNMYAHIKKYFPNWLE